MTWNIDHRTYQSRVIWRVHIYLWTREGNFSESLLHFRAPFLHKIVNVWHLFCIIYSRGWSCLVKILYAIDPTRNFFRLLISIFYWFDIHRSSSNDIFLLYIFHFNHHFIFMVQSWFIQNCDTKIFFQSIWFGHLQESINFSDTRNVFRNEGFQLCIKINFLRLVSLNILE